jgi:hypothetical protein
MISTLADSAGTVFALRVGIHVFDHVLGQWIGRRDGAFGARALRSRTRLPVRQVPFALKYLVFQQSAPCRSRWGQRIPRMLPLPWCDIHCAGRSRSGPNNGRYRNRAARAFALAANFGGARNGVADGERVHAVDDFGVHVVVGKTAARRAMRSRPSLRRRCGASCRNDCCTPGKSSACRTCGPAR